MQFDFIDKVRKYEKALIYWIENQENEKIYIPILRSLLECQHLNKEQLLNIAKEYNQVKNDGRNKVLTGLEMYESVDKIHNSDKIRDIRKFCKFLSHNFFDNLPVDLVPDRANGRILSFSINDEEIRGINQVGDGLQALILMLYPIYTASDKTWFFIEEPETNLHPGLQRVFIETLLGNEDLKEKKLRYFFTTHSNHFMDITLNSNRVAIFQFEKLAENEHRIKTNVKPDKGILDILGINTSSVFLANSSIWVEGPTDRKYLSKFLKLYSYSNSSITVLKEDIDFAFFEYAGSLIAHYIFEESQEYNNIEVRDFINAFKLSNKIYLLADSDNSTGKKALRDDNLAELSSNLNDFKYQNTKVKEIENLLPPYLLKEFLLEFLLNDDVDKNKLYDINFKQVDYQSIGLGEFFENLLKSNGIVNFRKFKSQTGSTLATTYKLKLNNFIIDKKIDYNDLVKENENLKHIIEDLYNFISN